MSYLLAGKRAKEIAAVAEKSRINYSGHDVFGVHRLAFTLFAQSPGKRAENVITAKLKGHPVRAFDFPYAAERTDGAGLPPGTPVMRHEDGRQYSCILVHVDADLPFLHISPRGRRNQFDPSQRPRSSFSR